ncbi:MAG: YgjV family protein [Clostridia bacterium]|nr:YgjV family protein [Clostridia bacterium]
MREIIGQICGVLVFIGCVLCTQFPKRWQMLLVLGLVNLFSVPNQLLVGSGLTAGLLCSVATVNCFLNAYKSKKGFKEHLWENIVFAVLYFTAWGIGFAASFKNGTPNYLDAFTFVATIFFLGQVFLPKERDMRICTMGNSFMYFLYDGINLNVAAFAKLFALVSAAIALIRYRKKDFVDKSEKL